MKQKYYIVTDDVFGVITRLQSLDSRYRILYYPTQKRYQLHYGYGPQSYQLTFEKLDSRIIDKIASSRVTKEKMKDIFRKMERDNQCLEQKYTMCQVDQARYQLKQWCGYLERHTGAMQ